MDVLKKIITGVLTQDQEAYEIFGELRITNMVIKIYVKINIGRSYQDIRPYSDVYCNNRYVSKAIRPHLK